MQQVVDSQLWLELSFILIPWSLWSNVEIRGKKFQMQGIKAGTAGSRSKFAIRRARPRPPSSNTRNSLFERSHVTCARKIGISSLKCVYSWCFGWTWHSSLVLKWMKRCSNNRDISHLLWWQVVQLCQRQFNDTVHFATEKSLLLKLFPSTRHHHWYKLYLKRNWLVCLV